jgi:hypothetical protein
MILPGKNGTSHDVIIEWVVNADQLVKLQEFATGCRHEFYFDSRLHRIAILKKKHTDRWIGWVKIPKAHTLHVSLCEEQASSRDTVEVIKLLRGWGIMEWGEVIFAVPLESKTFTPEILEKCGAYTMKSGLWIADGLI